MLPNAHINSWSVFVFFSVWLFHKRKFIGSGLLLGEQRQNIHGYPVAPDDIVTHLDRLVGASKVLVRGGSKGTSSG